MRYGTVLQKRLSFKVGRTVLTVEHSSRTLFSVWRVPVMALDGIVYLFPIEDDSLHEPKASRMSVVR